MAMSDTPKTDALWESYRTRTLKSIDDPVAEFSHLARTLETDLNATVHDMNLCRCEIIPKLERDLAAALFRAEAWKANSIRLLDLVDSEHGDLCPRFWNESTGVCDCGLTEALANHKKLMEGDKP